MYCYNFKRKSYNNLLGLILKREAFTLTVLSFFFKDVFTSCSGRESKSTFILENCKNSDISKNIEEIFLTTWMH